jgi:DNA-binding NarL/FixJ family response regulator
MRCLIVDDSVDFADAARNLLESRGFTVVGVAQTGVQALQCFDNLRPDVTLVDIDLGSENGFDVAEQLEQVGGPGSSTVILISTHAAEDFADLIEASPAVGFLAKSSLSSDAIRELLRQGG